MLKIWKDKTEISKRKIGIPTKQDFKNFILLLKGDLKLYGNKK